LIFIAIISFSTLFLDIFISFQPFFTPFSPLHYFLRHIADAFHRFRFSFFIADSFHYAAMPRLSSAAFAAAPPMPSAAIFLRRVSLRAIIATLFLSPISRHFRCCRRQACFSLIAMPRYFLPITAPLPSCFFAA
jgi:hypothetical protein